MKEINRDYCEVYAKLNKHKDLIRRTQSNIEEMLKISKTPYIAFSCGKDSSVLADMVLRIDNTVPLRFVSSGETRIIHNVDDVMDFFIKKYNAKIQEIKFDRVFSEEWKNATFDEQRKAGKRDIQSLDNSDYDGVFMGLRAEESRHRQISLAMHQTEGLPRNMYKYAKRDFYRMCPLNLWRTEDVGAYIVSNQIDVLDWYNTYGFDSRTTARITGDAVRQNVLIYLKITNPQGYAMLLERFPEFHIIT